MLHSLNDLDVRAMTLIVLQMSGGRLLATFSLPRMLLLILCYTFLSSIQTLIKDFSGEKPLYKAAHIFFLESELVFGPFMW